MYYIPDSKLSGVLAIDLANSNNNNNNNNNVLQINNYIRKLRRVGVMFLTNTTKHEISIKVGIINYI